MYNKYLFLFYFAFFFGTISCKKTSSETEFLNNTINQIEYADGFQLFEYEGFSVVRVIESWPGVTQPATFVLAENKAAIPDTLMKYTVIQVPVKRIIVTSTTHLPSLVSLNETSTLKAFPGLAYISSKEIRAMIDNGKIKEIGDGMGVNFELTIDIAPDVIITNGGTDNADKYQQIEQAGIPVIYNGDWVEQTPLGKAEWIKLFGVLYGKESEASFLFNQVADAYEETKVLASEVNCKPTIMSGAMYEDVWYAPQGNSWMAQIIEDAGGNYIWANREGKGSLFLSFEQALNQAKDAEVWIGPAQFTSYTQMEKASAHYKEFDAFQNKKIFTYSAKKGETGGIIFYEEATNRPDLLLKDFLKVLHPELIPEHELYFLSPLTE